MMLRTVRFLNQTDIDVMPKQAMKLSDIKSKTTEYIFRTAYYIAKINVLTVTCLN